MKKENVIELTRRLAQLRDVLYQKFHCDVITGRNTVALCSSPRYYTKELTRERFKGTDEDWEMYREARGIMDVLETL